MDTRPRAGIAARIGAALFFLSCLAALVPGVAGLLLLFDDNWSAWLDLTALGVAFVFVSGTLNFLLSGCFIPGCRS